MKKFTRIMAVLGLALMLFGTVAPGIQPLSDPPIAKPW